MKHALPAPAMLPAVFLGYWSAAWMIACAPMAAFALACAPDLSAWA